MITKPVLIALGTALALSILANAGLVRAYLGARDDLAEATGARDQARAAATSCADGVRQLQATAAERDREATRFRERAADMARGHQRRAQRILSAPPAFPGDQCRSAAAAIDGWLKERGRP